MIIETASIEHPHPIAFAVVIVIGVWAFGSVMVQYGRRQALREVMAKREQLERERDERIKIAIDIWEKSFERNNPKPTHNIDK